MTPTSTKHRNPSSSLPARPVAGGYEGPEVSDSGPAALSTDAAGDEKEIGYIGLMSWK